ncbi:MAG: hypothetical protein AB8E82_15165 [Aureispira sp.]
MNKEIQHLYTELSPTGKEELNKDYADAPKMLRYLELLEQVATLSTPKAVQFIYEEEYPRVEYATLTNRFYKLRKVLRVKLLDKLRNTLKSHTEEELELKFLRLLSNKNEHAYVLAKAQKLEKKYWEDNLFELLPELIHLIISTLHYHKAYNIEEIRAYVNKLDLANKLHTNLYQFKNHVNSFRLTVLGFQDLAELTDHYTSITTKMKRKVKELKAYPRFELIYHHTSFTIGAQLQHIAHKSGNALTRHLNRLEQLLAAHPNMPVTEYILHHRVDFMHYLFLNKAMYWYQKGHSKKSYQCILNYEQLKAENEKQYFSISGRTLANILLCCWGAKEYEAMLKYINVLKELQTSNAALKSETPYFVYELLAYTGLYPKKKHKYPEQLITVTEKFLKTANETSIWIYGVLGTFTMLYGDYERSRRLLEHPPLIAEYQEVEHNIHIIELLDAVEDGSYDVLMALIRKIRASKKKQQDRDVLTHLEELEMLTKLFL